MALLGVSKHPVFADSLRRVRQVVLARFVNEPIARPHITVVAYCRGGNHRSVAFGHLLWHVTSDTARQFIRCARLDVLNLIEGAGLWATPRRCGPCRWLTKMLSPCGRRSCNSTIEHAWRGRTRLRKIWRSLQEQSRFTNRRRRCRDKKGACWRLRIFLRPLH